MTSTIVAYLMLNLRWDVHLLGAGSPAGVLRPLTAGLSGSAA